MLRGGRYPRCKRSWDLSRCADYAPHICMHYREVTEFMKKLHIFLSAILTGCLVLTAVLLCACNSGQGSTTDTTDGSTDLGIDPSTNTVMDTEVPTEPLPDDSEPSETTAEEETTVAETETETYEVRLYSLMPGADALMNSFVIRTAHGKFIVIDGGGDSGAHLDGKAYMPAALRAIAGVGQDGYVEVEAWLLSHAHKDHFYELSKTLDEYAYDENFVVKQFIFDFPDYESAEYPSANSDSPWLEKLMAAMTKYAEARGIEVSEGSTYYDDLNGAFANATSIAEGCELEIDGVRIEFMQTWDKSDGTNINENTLVMRAWVEGQSILFLGDTYINKGNQLAQTYELDIKSDIVQMSHHGQNGVSKLVYDKIDAAVRIWPTPSWVWNDTVNHNVDDARKWVNGGVDFTTASEWDIVTCLYDSYPRARNRVSEWEKVIDGMYIPLPYASVNIAPPTVETEPEEILPDEPPIEHDYVSNGLVSMYLGGEGDIWVDVIGANDVSLTVNNTNYLAAEGLYLDTVRQFFPQAIVDLVNGDEFTVEMAMKDFTPLGTTYNTFMNSSEDAFALFRQCDGSNDFLMMKWAGKPAQFRPKTENGMLELLSEQSTLTLTFKVGGAVTIYVNGECVATYAGVDSLMLAGDLYIGHDQASRNYKALFTSVRFYDVALTAEQVAANAAVDAQN